MLIKKDSSKEEVIRLNEECSRCSYSCEYESHPLVEDDFRKISRHLGISEEELREKYLEQVEIFSTKGFRPKLKRDYKKPYGKCIFYHNNECALQEKKPLGCKIKKDCPIHGRDLAAWFNVNYFLDKNNMNSILDYFIYAESNGHIVPGAKPDEIFDEETKKKVREYKTS